jgi:hypothetical protein
MRPYLEKKNLHKNRAGGVAHGEGPEFKPQHCKKKVRAKLVFFYAGLQDAGGQPTFLKQQPHCGT